MEKKLVNQDAWLNPATIEYLKDRIGEDFLITRKHWYHIDKADFALDFYNVVRNPEQRKELIEELRRLEFWGTLKYTEDLF